MPANSDRPASSPAPGAPDAAGAPDAPAEASITLAADLHARPAGQLSVAAARFRSSVRLLASGREADAKSVLGVMQLGASAGTAVTVRAAGPDADAAVSALTAILAAVAPAGLPLSRPRTCPL